MALNYLTRYPGQVIDGGADYPEGQPRNVGTPGDGTGTPWEADLVKDLFGFLQGLTAAAGISVSGVPDTAVLSDRLAALKKITRRIGCQVDVTGTAADDADFDLEITRQSDTEGGFVVVGEDKRLAAPDYALHYVHFNGLVLAPESGANPALVTFWLHSAAAAVVYGVRHSTAGLHGIAVSGGGLIDFSGSAEDLDNALRITNKSETSITIAQATLTVVRVGSAVFDW